jgi:hypothetical protein
MSKITSISTKTRETIIKHHIPTSKDGVNTLASEMEEIILHAARTSLKIKKTKFRNKINNVCNKKWFDKECGTVCQFVNHQHLDN